MKDKRERAEQFNAMRRRAILKASQKAKTAPRRTKKRRKHSDRVKWKKKAIDRAKAEVRKLGYCQWCGKTKDEAQLHGSHIYSVSHEATAADKENILCLCSYDHLHVWHEKVAEAVDWCDQKFPGRRKRLWAKIMKHTNEQKYTAEDWERIYEELESKALDT